MLIVSQAHAVTRLPRRGCRRAAWCAYVIYLGLVLADAVGCASQTSPPPAQHAARPANRYVYVTTQNLPGECYSDLGAVRIAQPYGEAAVDADNSAATREIRAAALGRYPADVDAVINVQSEQNDVGTAVIVTGEAVRLEDSHSVKCALKGMQSVMDSGANSAAGGVAGATAGGLTGGAGGAASAGVAGAAMMGAYQVLQHEQAKQQQAAQLRDSLDDQRREIARLQQERSQLRKCRDDDVPLSSCESGTQNAAASAADPTADEPSAQGAVNAATFEIQRQIQEQQDYIKHLKAEIAQLKWEMAGH
jgi:hypothetical protein